MQHDANVSLQNVDITGGFWQQRQALNRDVTLYAVLDRFRDTGRFDAFRCDWHEGMPCKPHIFWDSDIAKWMEAVAYLLVKRPEPRLQAVVEGVIDQIERNQRPDGYFNSYFNTVAPDARFTGRGLHELYCAGHLIEAAVAYDAATGRDRFLRIMERYVALIDRVFRQEQRAGFATPGHEEIELALVRLYQHTGNAAYRTLAEWFIDQRGANKKDVFQDEKERRSSQSHLPCAEQHTAEGHAVRAGYLYSAMADVARLRDDTALQSACADLFTNIVDRRMYVTGGVGSSRYHEAFTVDYDLQNETAYNETCASIALFYFAQRMLLLSPDARYADAAETALYNGFLSGTSLDGRKFFYTNPMEIDVSHHGRNVCSADGEWLPIMERVEVFNCSCCPPNVTRFVASLGAQLYTYGEDCVYVHHYMESTAKWNLNGVAVELCQQTAYPVDGTVRVRVSGMRGKKLCLRIPGWCDAFTLDAPYTMARGYAVIDVTDDDAAYTLSLRMEPELLEANPRVHADAGRVAVRRGPVVYCAEGVDQPCALHELRLQAPLHAETVVNAAYPMPDLIVDGARCTAPQNEGLYRRYQPAYAPCAVRMIPYFAMANRGATDMQVWMLARA